MPKNSNTESKVAAYWPVVVTLGAALVSYGTLSDRVSANEKAIAAYGFDHDKLIDLRRRVEDIADFLHVPKGSRRE
jgi:hypothetical protein